MNTPKGRGATKAQDKAPDGLYSSKTLVEISGCSYRQIDYWTTTGHLKVAHTAGPERGPGGRRYYDGSQVMKASLLRYLLDPEAAAAIAESLTSDHRAEVPGFRIELTQWVRR